MGLLIEGKWHDQWYDTSKSGGRFERQDSQFRHWITQDAASASADSGFSPQPGRYHLYVSLACPWAHRALIFRKLKGLEAMISVSVVNPLMAEHGWTFESGPGVVPDPLYQARFLYQLYQRSQPDYSGRVTVPVLWDKQQQCIVNNESAEIIRMFNSAFDEQGAKPGDYYPAALRTEIDQLNAWIYERVNNGVYRAGFATRQEAYEDAVFALFEALDTLEKRLEQQRYLCGARITEADWRLFTTLLRFDPVYVGHFKCNLRRLVDYPNLWGYVRDLYQQPGIAETVNMDHIKAHYYRSHDMINPTGIVPAGPRIDFEAAHDRGARFGAG